MTVRIQREDFDVGAEIARLTQGRTDIGAVATFTGICRDDGIAAMTLEHYPGMAEAEIERHVEEAEKRWPLLGVTVIHRYGRLVPGENIVLVVTASSHREAAFAAAEFLMDYLKTRAPFWKKEERARRRRLGRGTANRRSRGRALDGRRQQTRSCRMNKHRQQAGPAGGERMIRIAAAVIAALATLYGGERANRASAISRSRKARIRTMSRPRPTARSGTRRSIRARSASSIPRPARWSRCRSARARRRMA